MRLGFKEYLQEQDPVEYLSAKAAYFKKLVMAQIEHRVENYVAENTNPSINDFIENLVPEVMEEFDFPEELDWFEEQYNEERAAYEDAIYEEERERRAGYLDQE